ncbi:unnamed protein product [Pleuronectes platessa]|uniref:Uncharacterized protein n=1 Tax=Pleuronectes platessa TaxID=8262 RepID=A0A9N7V6C8_PLEPL|nr:unnamed protein product [Pleuronectes platessa]
MKRLKNPSTSRRSIWMDQPAPAPPSLKVKWTKSATPFTPTGSDHTPAPESLSLGAKLPRGFKGSFCLSLSQILDQSHGALISNLCESPIAQEHGSQQVKDGSRQSSWVEVEVLHGWQLRPGDVLSSVRVEDVVLSDRDNDGLLEACRDNRLQH